MTGFSDFIVRQPGECCLYLRHPNQHNDMEVVSLMDASVYTKNRCFRLIESCKPGKQHLKWLADPVTGETEPPSTAELIFRGLISHSIDVAPESYLSMNVSNGIKKKTKQPESHPRNGLKSLKAQNNGAQDLVSLSDEKRAIVQTLLRSDRILGSQTEVVTCNIRSYGKKWSVVGQCRAGTAWCAVQTVYASVGASVKPQIHNTAVTNFSITTTKGKVWDWSCGTDKSKVILWSAQERAVVIKLLRGSPSAAAAGHHIPSSDESASKSASDVDTSSAEDSESQSETDRASESDSDVETGEEGQQAKGRHRAQHMASTSCSEAYEDDPPVTANSTHQRPDIRCTAWPMPHDTLAPMQFQDTSETRCPAPEQPRSEALPSRKRTVGEMYETFDSLNLHNVDPYSVRDMRPEPDTVTAIVAKWEQDNAKELKKLRRKYGPRGGKAKLQANVSALRKPLELELVTYLNLYFQQSVRMSEPVIIISLIKENGDGTKEWQHDMMAPKSFELSYGHLKTTIGGAECKIAKMWLEHSHAARFDRLKFEPLPKGVVEKRQKVSDYNLWKGFKVSLADAKQYLERIGRDQCAQQIRPFLEHIMHVWCRGEITLYNYVLNWMAWCIQRPNQKTEVAIAIRGDKGSGKGVIMQMLGKVYGKEYFFHAQKEDDLLGKFNDHLQTCMLCFVDEVTFANDKTATNILKTIITETTVNINTKFKSRFSLNSYMNVILAGNLSKIVECDGKERRFLVLETNDKWSGSQNHQSAQYFARLASVPSELLRYFFSSRDISQFNPKVIPSSAAMRDQKALSFKVVESWLQRCLVRGRISWTTLPRLSSN